MNEIMLTKSSGSEELRAYFNAVLNLSQQNNEFPVNLDDVWMLVYSNKNKAVRALRKDFIEGEDFTTMTQNGQGGKFATTYYYLSTSCLEYFIARKVRAVFDVYRQVFHKAATTTAKLPTAKELAMLVLRAEEEKEKLLLANQQQEREIERRDEQISAQNEEIKQAAPKVQYYDQVLQSQNTLTTTQVAKQMGMEANSLNKKLQSIGIQFRQSGQWMLHSPYSKWDLHATRTQTYTRSDMSIGSSSYMVWKQRGVMFIHALAKNEWNIRKAVEYINGKTGTTG